MKISFHLKIPYICLLYYLVAVQVKDVTQKLTDPERIVFHKIIKGRTIQVFKIKVPEQKRLSSPISNINNPGQCNE
jgi:hypothetical protein